MDGRGQALASGVLFEGRYEILAKLGEGGFGSVFKARQLTTGQEVAVKVMRASEHANSARLNVRAARFLREARLCAQLHHPNIVRVLDSGQASDGQLYTVFAYAPGDNLAAVLARDGALAPVEAQRLMLQVLDALACAHAQGIVHRDLKPSNIMIIPTGVRPNALVLDFGIGAVVDASPNEPATRLTASEDTLGTPGYCAPEQSRGVEPSPRSDLFSWALVLIECLVGRRVYEAASPAEIFYRLLGPEPVPVPSVLQRHPVGAILARALEKDVGLREVTAAGLHESLRACDLSDLSGLTLASRAVLSPLASTETSRLDRRERRQVTALGCVVHLSSDRALEPEDADEILHRALSLCAEAARAHQGVTVSAFGDGLLVYFGYPHAEEGDAARAGRAALSMVQAVRSADVGLVAPARVEVGIGLHTDFVLAAPVAGLGSASPAAGRTPGIAVEVARGAGHGAILVTPVSRELLQGGFEIGDGDARSISTPFGAVSAYVLGRERDPRTDSRSSDEARGPLVGRDRELDLLLERWRRVREGAGQCALVTGEPGIGKSRLVRELRARLADGDALFVEGRCSPDTEHTALVPVVELLVRALGLDDEIDAGAKRERLEQQLEACGLALADAMPVLLPLLSLPVAAPYTPLDVSPARQKALTLNAVTSLLLALAERRPVLLLVEDLHWADSTTLEVIARLVHEAPSVPMCVLMTARPEFSPSFATTVMLQLHLTRLNRPEIEAMVASLAGQRALPVDVVEQVVGRTDGVPLFVEELTRMLLESSDSQTAIPSTLRALITVRLDRLGRAKETAQIASAIGREFGVDLLSAVSPLGQDGLREDLDRLTSAGLLLRKSRLKDPTAAFKHALVRDAAYESLPRGARREVHARIALALEERFADVAAGRPDLLAQHHAAADDPARAVPYALRAAQLALKRTAYVEAVAQASSAIAWATGLAAEERVEAELVANGILTQATMATRGWADAKVKATVDRSTALLEQVAPDSPHRVPTLWFLFTYHHVACNRAAARAVARQVTEIAERRGDRSLAVAAAALLGVALHADGDHVGAREALDRAAALHDPAADRDHGPRFGLDSLVLAKTLLGHHQWHAGEDAQAFHLVAEALEWARETRHVPSIAIGLLYGCQVHQFAGDKATVAAMTGEIVDLATKYGLPAYEGYARVMHDWAAGDGHRAQEIIARLLRTGSRASLSYFGSLAADRAADRGDLGAAIEGIEQCIALCAQNDEHLYEPELHRRLGVYRLRQGPDREQDARRAFEEAARLARRYHMPRTEAAATRAIVDRFGGGGEERERLAELLSLHPGLRP